MTEPSFQQDYELIVAPNFDPRFTPAEIPAAGVFDNPTYMICINAQWWTHLLGTIDRLAYTDAWKSGDYQAKLDAVDSVLTIMNEIGKSIECGDMATYELRQNPANLCQLQQSLDGGVSWTTVFDYSQCGVGGGGSTNINIQIGIDHITNLNNEWNIDVDIVYNNIKADDVDTDIVYCLGLRIFYFALLSGIIERVKRGNNQNLITQAVAVGAAAVTAFVVGTPLTGALVAIGGVVSLIAQDQINIYNENQLVFALNSESIFQEIVCCAYKNIEGTKIGFVDFQNMFSGCTDLSPEAQEIIPLFQEAVTSFDAFLSWLSAINTAYSAAENNAMPNLCLCDEWCRAWLMGKGTDGYIDVQDPGGAPAPATYDPVNDRYIGDKWENGATGRIDIVVNAEVTSMRVRSSYKVTRASSLDGLRILNDGVELTHDWLPATGDYSRITDLGGFSAGTIRIMWQAGGNSASDACFAWLNSIEIRGTGDSPFGLDNCDAPEE